MKTLFIIIQYLVPQQLLSRAVGKLANCQWPWLKNLLIQQFIRQYRVDMSEAADPEPANYTSFNAFFTRALRADARPLDASTEALCCPADGAISQLGAINGERVFQAKGQTFSVYELLGNDAQLAKTYQNGSFATIYLSPQDYHRVHMPCAATLQSMTYIPGDLFSVNQTTAENVPRLFARNERLVCQFDTEHGPMAMVLVGAMIVAGIETVWSGQVAPVQRTIRRQSYQDAPAPVVLGKGEEMGRFKLGSTVILLFPEKTIEWRNDLKTGSATQMGEEIASWHKQP